MWSFVAIQINFSMLLPTQLPHLRFQSTLIGLQKRFLDRHWLCSLALILATKNWPQKLLFVLILLENQTVNLVNRRLDWLHLALKWHLLTTRIIFKKLLVFPFQGVPAKSRRRKNGVSNNFPVWSHGIFLTSFNFWAVILYQNVSPKGIRSVLSIRNSIAEFGRFYKSVRRINFTLKRPDWWPRSQSSFLWYSKIFC